VATVFLFVHIIMKWAGDCNLSGVVPLANDLVYSSNLFTRFYVRADFWAQTSQHFFSENVFYFRCRRRTLCAIRKLAFTMS